MKAAMHSYFTYQNSGQSPSEGLLQVTNTFNSHILCQTMNTMF